MTDQISAETAFHGLPRAADAQAVFDLVMSTEAADIARHSIRSYLFSKLIAEHRGAALGRDYDPVVLFAVCALHDIGLTEAGNRNQRFEIDGADLAAEFLTTRGWPASDVDTVWEAIALHTSTGIAERRGTICVLAAAGIAADVGLGSEIVPDDTAEAIHRAYPRGEMARTLVDTIVAQASANPQKAPPFSLTSLFVSERATKPISTLEYVAKASRWGA